MMTINFKALAAPIPKSEVKTRPGGGGKKLSFITARQVMNRLDTVCGPENWRDEYALSLTGTGIQCTLFIRIDGEWIGKTDVGTESNTEEDKGAYSDALKRAGVKWGIARELHGDGVADLGGRDRKTAPPANDSGPRSNTANDGYEQSGSGTFPTIGEYWPNAADSLLDMQIEDWSDALPSVGGIVYGPIEQLGYKSDGHVKKVLGLKSSFDFDGTLRELLEAVLLKAPKFIEEE